MTKVMDLDSPENVQLRNTLVELLLARTQAIKDKRPINNAIRLRCSTLKMGKPPRLIYDMLEQIRRKPLCEHELLKCITSYNELVNGEVEMIRDGEVVIIKGNQAPIE